MKWIVLLILAILAGPAAAQPADPADLPDRPALFYPDAVFVFTPADHARLTHAMRGTPYYAAFRRAKVVRVLSDGAVPGLIPVVMRPRDADRLWREFDRGRPVGRVDGHLRDVLHMTVQLGWSDPDAE